MAGDILSSGRYYLRVEDEAGNPLEYGLYINSDTWRPPTRSEIPAHWFTTSSPQTFARDYAPPWATNHTSTRDDMQSFMGENAKRDDGHPLAS
jgi:hypothetical protein